MAPSDRGSPGRSDQVTDHRAYLDHAATTPMLPEAVEAMLPFLGGAFGNPSGAHREARQARQAIDETRGQIASLLGVDAGSVVFTASGTEADNLAVVGAWRAAAGRTPPPVVCSAMEHHAVLNTCRALAQRTGAELREVATGKDGLIDLEALSAACTPDVGLVSVMAVNNELGTIQPMGDVAALVRQSSPSAVLHSDAVQAVPWLDVGTLIPLVDLVSLSAHKFGGPKGVGLLVTGDGIPLQPLIHGGGQERERRSGTHNVAGIVATGKALAVTVARRTATVERVTALRDRLGDGLLRSVAGTVETGDRAHRVAGTVHMRFAGVESEALVLLLDEAGVAASAGAACSSGAVEVSHVLVSMGLRPDEASTGIRFSLGATTTGAVIDHALAVVPGAVAQLRD
jgi:cysteine desulfurase